MLTKFHPRNKIENQWNSLPKETIKQFYKTFSCKAKTAEKISCKKIHGEKKVEQQLSTIPFPLKRIIFA